MLKSFETQNLSALSVLKKEKLSYLKRLRYPLKTKYLRKKIKQIPRSFLRFFDQESYLAVNPDIKEALLQDHYKSALEHFIESGYDEVKEGKRQIGKAFPLISELEYAQANPDVKKAYEEGELSSPFTHFIHFGYTEFLKGERRWPGVYPFYWSSSLEQEVKHSFDASLYLKANQDVAESVGKGLLRSAWEHFYLYGAEEIRRGERTLYPDIPKMSEADYYWYNRDIFDQYRYADIHTPFEHFLRYGVKEILSGERIIRQEGVYFYRDPQITEKIRTKMKNFENQPLISVIMPVYNVEVQWLQSAIDSLRQQWYGNWELCIADDASTEEETVSFLKHLNDPRIKCVFLAENLHISGASNEALKLAKGDYIALMDNDDELTPHALYEVVRAINDTGAEFIYSDEDKIESDGQLTDPHFKPDYAPDMFLSQNYISHLSVIKKSLVEEVSGWTVGLEGSQDYDLYLKVFELTDKIVHIPKVLYHWRKVAGSTAAEYGDKSYAWEAGRKALVNAMHRRGLDAEVFKGKYPGTYRVKYTLISEPLVSIVIPFKDKPELLEMCINSILDRSTYQNFEIIGMSNNSEEKETFEMMKALKLKDTRVSFYEYNKPFNYSAINNFAVEHYTQGEHIVLLNNDIEIISPEWIESMLEFSQREDVGAVGAKLYYPNDTIQHAGISLGVLALAGHNFRHLKKGVPGYMGRESVIQNISAVTAACLMVKTALYRTLNGLNENDLKIAFNDVDFCLRIREKNYLNVYTPYATAYHHESLSRGLEDTTEKQKRFNSEVKYMLKRHQKMIKQGDPYYNSNLTLKNENFAPKG